MSKNSFNLLSHLGNTIYQNTNDFSKNCLNSFCLLNKTIGNINTPKEINKTPIDLKQMKEYDKLNNEKAKFQSINDLSTFYTEKNNFIQNSFYNTILENKKKFENIHKDVKEFRMLQDEDKSNSSLFYYTQIIQKLKKNEELKKVEEKMKNKMENLEKYEKENYSLISNIFECNGINKDFSYYKRVKANGNSFYISFIYQYIKNIIYQKQESKITEIFYIMDKELYSLNNNNNNNNTNNENILGQMYIYNSINNNESTNLMQVYAFMYLLYNNMINRNINEAENILDYAFSYEESFANFFCLFMRIQIKSFIINNKDYFTYENYCKQNKLIEEKYYKDGKFLYKEYINNNVLINQKEPTLFIISLVPYVFNVSMNLYINEKNYKFEKICFDLKINFDTNITISILYSSFSYHIIETNSNYINEGKDNIDFSDTLNLNNKNIKFKVENYIVNVNEKKVCEDCKKSEFVLLRHISQHSVCLNCLKKTIDDILIERYGKMIIEKFRYLEFYLRDIPIKNYNDNDFINYIFISPPEFYCLFKSNIFRYFRNLIENICVHCRKFQNILIEKNCGCKYCLKGLQKEINSIPLIDFEKNYIYKNKKIKCQCGKDDDYVELALKLYDKYDNNEKDKIKKSYDSRINNLCKNYCMFCGTVQKTNSIGKAKKDIKKIKLDDIEHLICENCQKDKQLSDLCLICGKGHKKINNNSNNISQNISKNGSNNDNSKDNDNNNDNEGGKTKREKTVCCIIY